MYYVYISINPAISYNLLRVVSPPCGRPAHAEGVRSFAFLPCDYTDDRGENFVKNHSRTSRGGGAFIRLISLPGRTNGRWVGGSVFSLHWFGGRRTSSFVPDWACCRGVAVHAHAIPWYPISAADGARLHSAWSLLEKFSVPWQSVLRLMCREECVLTE